MINNLIIVNRQYDYGYDSYYVARKDESVDFPSDSAIVRNLSPIASQYVVESKPLSVMMKVSGTLKSQSYSPAGYLSKIAKHFVVKNEMVDGELDEEEEDYVYVVLKSPIVTGTLKGFIINDGEIIQRFTTEKGSTTLDINDVVSPSIPELTKATSGSYEYDSETGDNKVRLVWNDIPTNSSIVISYEYESPNSYSVTTSRSPIADNYNFVSLYGETTLDTKYVKISSTFKCKYKEINNQISYTDVKSRLFYTRCRSFQSLCSSKSNGYVPSITVCSERLF